MHPDRYLIQIPSVSRLKKSLVAVGQVDTRSILDGFRFFLCPSIGVACIEVIKLYPPSP